MRSLHLVRFHVNSVVLGNSIDMTVGTQLHPSGFVVRDLHLAPYERSPPQRAEQINAAIELEMCFNLPNIKPRAVFGGVSSHGSVTLWTKTRCGFQMEGRCRLSRSER
jgi:hypothetical protein